MRTFVLSYADSVMRKLQVTADSHFQQPIPPIPLYQAIFVFAATSLVFFVFLYVLLPLLRRHNVSWFACFNLTLAAPMFLLVACALLAYAWEGNPLRWHDLRDRFRLRRMGLSSWIWTVGLAIFMFGGRYSSLVAFACVLFALGLDRSLGWKQSAFRWNVADGPPTRKLPQNGCNVRVADNPKGTRKTDDTELGERISLLSVIEGSGKAEGRKLPSVRLLPLVARVLRLERRRPSRKRSYDRAPQPPNGFSTGSRATAECRKLVLDSRGNFGVDMRFTWGAQRIRRTIIFMMALHPRAPTRLRMVRKGNASAG